MPRALLNLALAEAHLQVEEAGRDPQLAAQARAQAEHALSCLFEALGGR